jgi:hypothetical protein
MLLMALVPLSAMLCFAPAGTSRWPAFAATAILFFGLAFPPNTPEFARQLVWWRDVGGAGWCMVLMLPFYFIAGFTHIEAAQGVCRETTLNDASPEALEPTP